jgi:hypothetical protein
MSDIRALNWFQRLQPKLTVVQVFLPILAGIFWALTAGFLGQSTPEWVEPLALSVGLLVPVLIFGIDKVFPRDIDSVVEQLICNSDMVEDWYVNPEYSGPDMILSGKGTLNGDIGEQKREIAVYKKDPSLVITLYRSEGDNKEFMEKWKSILNIDGGRCYFPLPKSPKPPIRSHFLSIAICQILNKKADYSTQFYIKRAGVDILDVDRFDPKIVSGAVN